MINHFAPNLPAVVLEDLLNRTDGNPLFIEEVTKFVLESGEIKEDKGSYQLKGKLGNVLIPNTLQDSLMARLDQVGNAKEVAQIGATIGREFSKSLVKAISNYDEERLNDHLKKLVLAQLLLVNPDLPNSLFAFKHALIQEAAYSSLLKKRRQGFHNKIVSVLEENSPELVLTNPELFAHHSTKAGLIEKAIPYWRKAGELAISRSAHEEALSHLNEGLALLSTLPDSQKKISDEILFQIALGVPLTALRGYGSIEVEKAYARARELCQKAGDTWQLIPALYGLWRYYLLRAQYAEAQELSSQILNLSDHSDNRTYAVIGNRASGSTKFYTGDLESASKHFDIIFKSQTTPEMQANTHLYDVVDAWVTSKSYASLTYWLLGFPDTALKHSNDAINMAKNLDHPFSQALSLSFAAWHYQFRGDVNKTFECAHEGLRIARENGFAFWVGWGEILEGWAKEENGSEAQLELIKGGLKTWYATGSKLGSSYFLYLLSESLMTGGNLKEAKECLARAKNFISETGEKWWEPEVYRLEGILFESQKNPDLPAARDCYQKALKVAKSQCSKTLELKAATNLAKVSSTLEEKAYSKKILEELIMWFKEGGELEDMKKAEQQLAILK